MGAYQQKIDQSIETSSVFPFTSHGIVPYDVVVGNSHLSCFDDQRVSTPCVFKPDQPIHAFMKQSNVSKVRIMSDDQFTSIPVELFYEQDSTWHSCASTV